MRDKTEAAKALMDAGWSLEEVLRVLVSEPAPPVVIPVPQPQPLRLRPTHEPWWETITTRGITINDVPTLTS